MVEHAVSLAQITGPLLDDEEDDGDPHVRVEDGKISPVVDFVAAGLVSSLSKIVVYPMETQVSLIAIGSDVANDARLWHGVVVKAFENFWYNGLLWFLKEWVRPPAADPSKPETRPPASFCGAFGISCAAIMLAHPLQTVTAGMQASLKDATRKPLSALAVARQIVSMNGFSGFFQGWKFSIALRVGSALTLVVYEFVRRRTARFLGSDVSNLLAGLLGRLAEVWSCHPLKTLRSRQQNGQPVLTSISAVAIIGLWSGVGTQGFADAVKIGIRFLLIERMRSLLQKLVDKRQRQRKLPATPKASEEANELNGPPPEAVGA